MNKENSLNIFVASLLAILVTGCSEESSTASSTTSSATTSTSNVGLGPSTPTGIASHRDFTIGFDPGSSEVFTEDGFTGGEPVSIIIRADDINDLSIDGQIVNIRTEWGRFSDGSTQNSCTLQSGTCSVTWLPGDKITAPSAVSPLPAESAECRVAFTAWTRGEEKFSDNNGNGLFDAGEIHLDLPEPYLDVNESGLWSNPLLDWNTGWGTAGADPGFCNSDLKCEIIDTNGDGVHNAGDGQYNGSLCGTSAICSTTTSIFIWTTSHLLISAEYDHDNNSATADQVFCASFK